MSLTKRLLMIVWTGAFSAIMVLSWQTYRSAEERAYATLYRESDAIFHFLMSVRSVFQQQFLDSEIPLNKKTIGFLPAHATPKISKEFARRWGAHHGVTVATVSDRPRNLLNQADSYELEAMAWFKEHPEQEVYTREYRELEQDSATFLYASPLWIESSCLKCHGEKEQAPKTIREQYATAYGYQLDELRGVVSIRMPVEEINQKIMAIFLPKLIILMVVFLLLSAVIHWVINHYIRQPLKQMMDGMQRIQGEHPNHRLPLLPGELGQVGDNFNQMVDQLQQSMEDLIKQKKVKDDFLASMSHELRTPLTTIIGNSELMGRKGLDQDQQQLLNSINISGHTLLYLVNDVLDFSKIQAGKFSIDQHMFDLTVLLEEIALIFSAQASAKGLAFVVQREGQLKEKVWGDDKRIGQILINLLSNAVKFTAQGEVALLVSVICDDAGEQLCFSVRDDGIGVSPKDQARLFQPFEQADNTISRQFGGTGLGLHISWRLAQLMEGTITVVSELGHGACFDLLLPLKRGQSIEQQQQRVQQEATHETFKGEVLLAEDTIELQMLIKRILQSYGLRVTVANNGREAIEQWEQERFDLILMDMQMPEMDGIEATQQLRALGCSVPVVALTANVLPQHRERFDKAGGDGFLEKPLDRKKLQRVLLQYLELA